MAVTRHLVRPTRGSSGPGRTSPPIWPCSDWGLPCHALLPAVRWALTPPFHPYPPLGGRSLLCGPLRRLTAPRRYLAVCPVELGLSSARVAAGRDRRPPPFPWPRIIPMRRPRGHPGPPGPGAASGRNTVNTAPPFVWLAPRTRPPCSRTTRCTMERPNPVPSPARFVVRSEEHTSELQSPTNLVCR